MGELLHPRLNSKKVRKEYVYYVVPEATQNMKKKLHGLGSCSDALLMAAIFESLASGLQLHRQGCGKIES